MAPLKSSEGIVGNDGIVAGAIEPHGLIKLSSDPGRIALQRPRRWAAALSRSGRTAAFIRQPMADQPGDRDGDRRDVRVVLAVVRLERERVNARGVRAGRIGEGAGERVRDGRGAVRAVGAIE